MAVLKTSCWRCLPEEGITCGRCYRAEIEAQDAEAAALDDLDEPPTTPRFDLSDARAELEADARLTRDMEAGETREDRQRRAERDWRNS